MQVGKIKNRAKMFLGVNKYYPLLLNAGMTGILVVILLLTFALSHVSGWTWLMWYGIVLLAAFYVFSAPVAYSATDFYIRAFNTKNTESFRLFEGFKKENFWRSVLIRLIRTGMGLGFTVLLIVPGVMFLLRTAFVYYVINNNPTTKAWDAIRESNQLVKGHTGELFKICLTFTGWFLLGIITFGLAFIYVSPYYRAVKTLYFRAVLIGVKDASAAATKSGQKSAPKQSGELNDQIEMLERQIKAMESGTNGTAPKAAAPKTQVNTQNVQSAPKSDLRTENVAPTAEKEKAVVTETENVSAEPLVLDEVGDITLTSGDRVEEVELPTVEKPKESADTSGRDAPESVTTREIEIMENESFEDFKARVAKLRNDKIARQKSVSQERPAAEQPKTQPQGAQQQFGQQQPPQAQPRQSVNNTNAETRNNQNAAADGQRRLSREEILEKIKRERNAGK